MAEGRPASGPPGPTGPVRLAAAPNEKCPTSPAGTAGPLPPPPTPPKKILIYQNRVEDNVRDPRPFVTEAGGGGDGGDLVRRDFRLCP